MDTRKSAMRTRSHSLIQAANNQQTNGGTGTRTRHKSGNASYADLITRAILSTDEKRLTLSEIYDWMVDNVPGLKDQRYLHSAKGWKNAVRHTLSINPRFRKLARLGRPGWWTVDPDFVGRSTTASIGAVPPSMTTTSATLIWDGPHQQQSNPNGFRGRLSSAPALFLSPIFATSAAPNIGFSCPTPVPPHPTPSRPPSSMSMVSNGNSCTPIASPTSDSVVSPPPSLGGTQTVQVWQEQGGVGVLAVPRPLPVRMASLNETGTQTEVTTDQPNPMVSMVAIQQRYIGDYFENVSPVSSPRNVQVGMDRQMAVGQQQSMIPGSNQPHMRVSLGRCADGRPILIVTNTTLIDHSGFIHQIPPQQGLGHPLEIPVASMSDQPPDMYHITDLSDHKPITMIKPPGLEQLPEDLEGINVDPSVRCDVVAVINYEQNKGRNESTAVQKLESMMEISK